jgi:hypothetical protein
MYYIGLDVHTKTISFCAQVRSRIELAGSPHPRATDAIQIL